jgi:hypothetical protein
MSSSEIFVNVMQHFLTMENVKKQGNSLKFKTKMFAMLNKEQFVVKLPENRVNELLSSGEGLPYDAGAGKQLKEWVIIPTVSLKKWIEFALEAKDFVSTLIK